MHRQLSLALERYATPRFGLAKYMEFHIMPLIFEFAEVAVEEEFEALCATAAHHGFAGNVIAVVADWVSTGKPPTPNRPHKGGVLVLLHDGGALALLFNNAEKLLLLVAGSWSNQMAWDRLVRIGLGRV